MHRRRERLARRINLKAHVRQKKKKMMEESISDEREIKKDQIYLVPFYIP